MEKEQYKVLYDLEDTYWWHVGLRHLILSIFKLEIKNKKNIKILDAGCGTGGNLEELNALAFVIGVDLSREALVFCKKRGFVNLVENSVANLSFKDNYFDMLLSVDVLYHRSIDDDCVVLKELSRVLKKNGILILHLPAFEFLRRDHDVAVHTQRRYTSCEIRKKLDVAGFKIREITYRNFLSFLAVLFMKVLCKEAELTEFKPLPKWLNSILLLAIKIENLFISCFKLPLGLSIFCIATKR